MTVKKEYNIGDPAWIYGIGPKNRITKGKIIAAIDLNSQGFTDIHYIVEVPTHIEPLLEIRTWHTISQDDQGPIGSFRDIGLNLDSEHKKISHLGYTYDGNSSDEDPTPDEIMAALEKSKSGLVHKPLHIKEPQQKRRYYPRKKK